nr:hypothetical protein [Tanacetum cinerariifolium]
RGRDGGATRVGMTMVVRSGCCGGGDGGEGANEELSDRGSPRVIMYGYDGFPMLLVAPPSPDYVPGPEKPQTPPSPDYVLSAEEQPLPPIVSPTAESPEYDEDEEEEEEHLASADSDVVIPTDELFSPPEGTEPVMPPPPLTLLPLELVSFPLEAEVERLLAMPTPPPSPLASLSLPSTGERLARCTAPAALPSPPPPPPPPLHMPPPVDRRDDIPETDMPPHKRLCLSTLGSTYEDEESYTARPIRGQGIDYGFVSTLDAEARRRGIGEVGYGIRDTWVDPTETVPKIAPMIVREVNTRVTELAELHEHDTQDLYALLEDA